MQSSNSRRQSLSTKSILRRSRPLALAAAAAASFVSVRSVKATSDLWTGAVNGSWANSGNWNTNPNPVPGAGDTATFATSSNTTIDLGAGVTIGAIRFDPSASAYTIGAGAVGSQLLTLNVVGTDVSNPAIRLDSAVGGNELFNSNLSLATSGNYILQNNSTTNSVTYAGAISASTATTGIKIIQIDGAGATSITGAMGTSGGSLNLFKTGAGTLTLSGGGSFTGNGIAFGGDAGAGPGQLREGTTRFAGGSYSFGGEFTVGGVVTNGGEGQNTQMIVDAGTVNITGFFSLGRGNGIGNVSSDVVLNNNANITAANFSGGFNAGNAGNLPKGSLTLNNTSSMVISGNGVFLLGESSGSNLTMTLNGASSLIATGTGNHRIGAGGNGSLIMNGTSSVNFGNQTTYVGYRNNAGYLEMNGSASFNSVGEVRVGGSDLNGTAVNGTGIWNLNGGSATVGALTVARGNNNQNTNAGTVNVNGGTLTSLSDVVLGFAGNSNLGYVKINGGALNVGTTAEKWLIMDQFDTARAQVDIVSGTLNLNQNTDIRFFTGNTGTSGSGTINQSGGWVNFYNDNATTFTGIGGVIDMARAGSATAVSEYNLNGGTVTVGQILSTTTLPTRRFNLNGGYLRPTGSSNAWINLGTGSATLNVLAGGAKFDTRGFDVTINSPLLGGAGDGGLTKDGLGALTLGSVSNTYTGPTTINAGKLVINGNLTTTSAVFIGSGAILNARGNSSTGGTLTSAGTIDLTDLAAGTLNTAALALHSSALNFEFAGGVNDRINSTGAASDTGTSTINIANATGALTSGSYTLITATGGLGSGFTVGNKPPGFFNFSLSSSTPTAEILTIAGNPTPSIAYWTGLASRDGTAPDANNNWGYGSNLVTAKSNWSTTLDGLSDPVQVPGASTSVIFTAANAVGTGGVLTTQLDASYGINSLTFDVPASTGITSAAINTNAQTLTVGSGGVTLAATSNASGNLTGTGQVRVSGNQGWANNNDTKALNVNVPVSAVTSATTLSITGNGVGGVNIGGPISNGGGTMTLDVNQAGNTTLTASNSYTGNTFVNRGNLVVDSGGQINGGTNFNSIGQLGSDVGSLTLKGSGIFNLNADLNFGDIGSAQGTLTIQDSAQLTLGTAGAMYLGSANAANSTASGVVNQTGGTVTINNTGNPTLLVGGRRNDATTAGAGTYNISGGTFTNHGLSAVGNYGTGVINQTGGVFNANNWLVLARFGTGKGTYNISAGTLLQDGSNYILVGQDGAATLNISGTGVVNTLGVQFGLFPDAGTTPTGTVNLDGGTLIVNGNAAANFTGAAIGRGAGAGTFFFNGGTLQANVSTTSFMQNLTGAYVKNGGALINTQANNITIAQPLLHDPNSNAIDGGLTKTGSGALTLTGSNTYTGPTNVTAGTLVVSNGQQVGGGTLTVASGAALTVNGSTPTSSLPVAALALNTATLGFGLGLVGNPTAPLISDAGGLSRVGTNTVNVTGASLSNGTITLIQYAGAETGAGNFTLGTLPNRVTGQLFDLGTGKVDLKLTLDIPKWTGLGDGSWTTAVQTPTKNWVTASSNTPTDYIEGDLDLFDDTATGTRTVNIPANVNPGGVTVNNSGGNYTIGGVGAINGSGALVKSGSSALIINGSTSNGYTSGTVINGGTVEIGGGLNSTTDNIPFLGVGSIVNNGVINSNRAPLNNNEFAGIFLNSAISGTGSIIASQNTILAGNNSYSGIVDIKSGVTVFADSATAFGNSVGSTTVEDGGRIAIFQGAPDFGLENFTITGTGPTYLNQTTSVSYSTGGAIYVNNNNVTMGGTITMTGSTAINVNGGTLTLNGNLNGSGNDLTKNGGGRLVIAGPATYNNAFIGGGNLRIGNNGTTGNLGSGGVNLTGGSLEFARTDTYTVSNDIEGTGTVSNVGAGTAILTNQNSQFFGTVAATNGTLLLQGAGFPGAFLVSGNGVLRVANSNYSFFVNSVNVNSNNTDTGALELSDGVSSPFGGQTVNFAGRNNASSGIRSTNGSNSLDGTIALGTGGSEYRIEAAAGGTFNVTANITGAATLGTGGRNLTFAGAGIGTMSGVISDGGAGAGSTTVAVLKAGSGMWTITGASTYTGVTTVNGGTLDLATAAQTPIFGTGASGANITNGDLVLEHGGDGGAMAANVKSILTAGYGQTPKFSAGTLRSSAADATKGLGWKDDGNVTTVGYVYYGDSNLDGTVNTGDFNVLAQHFNQIGRDWMTGDFNYDGKVNALDFNAVATNFGQTIVTPAEPLGAGLGGATLGSLVPEPGSIILLAIGGLSALRRRRRRA